MKSRGSLVWKNYKKLQGWLRWGPENIMGRNLEVNCWDGESLKQSDGCQGWNWDEIWTLPSQSHPLSYIPARRASERRGSEGLHGAGARNGLWFLLAEAELLSGAGTDVWHLRSLQERLTAVKWEQVTHDTDAWQALAYGNLWMLFSLTCTLDIARSKRDFGEELVKCVTKEKAVLSWGLMSKQDRARPHYFAVSHIYLPFIPFLNWNTSSDHRVILMWWAHPCTVMFGLVNQHGEISETFGEIFSEIVLYLRTWVLRQLFCCSFVVWGTDPTSKEKGVIIFQAFVNFFFLLTNLLWSSGVGKTSQKSQ